MDDLISRRAVLKLLSTMPPEEAITKAMLIQNVKYMSAAQPEKRTEERTEKHACDCISRQAAIEAIKEDKIDLTNPNVVAVFKATGDFEKVETQVMTCDRHIEILKDLPSAQPETADCIYCHEDSDGYVKPIEKNCHASIRFGMNGWEISLSAKGWNGSAKIRYCPMCGRDLFAK